MNEGKLEVHYDASEFDRIIFVDVTTGKEVAFHRVNAVHLCKHPIIDSNVPGFASCCRVCGGNTKEREIAATMNLIKVAEFNSRHRKKAQ